MAGAFFLFSVVVVVVVVVVVFLVARLVNGVNMAYISAKRAPRIYFLGHFGRT